MTSWRLIDSGAAPAWRNMALDEAVARETKGPVLRLYGWSSRSVSIGCFQDAAEVNLEYISERGVVLVRRITGGRGILHGNELTYSFSAPGEGAFSGGLRQNYSLLGSAFARAFEVLGLKPEVSGQRRASAGRRSPLCFESTSFGEIRLGGKKVVGSAQKRWPGRFMQQGSIPFSIDFRELARVFGQGGLGDAERCMTGLLDIESALTVDSLKVALVDAFEEVFDIRFERTGPTAEEERHAFELEGKYRSDEWNLSRQRQALSSSR